MPLLLPLAIPFFAFAAAIVIVGLQKTHTAAHGSDTSTGFWQFLSSGLLKTLFGQVARLGRFVLSHFAASQLDQLAKWFVSIGTLTAGWFGVSALFAEAIVTAVERVHHLLTEAVHRIDRAAVRLEHRLTREIHAVRSQTRAVARTLHRFEATVRPEIRHLTHAIDVTLPRDIGRVRSREESLSRDLSKLWKRTKLLEHGAIKTFDWIRTHPFGAAAAAFAGALAAVLSWPGIRALRCNEFGSLFNKRGCGLWSDLDALLGLVVTGFAIADFETLVKEAQGVTEDVTKGVLDLLQL